MVLSKKSSYLVFTAFSLFILSLALVFFMLSYQAAVNNHRTRVEDYSYLLEEWINEYFLNTQFLLDNITRQLPLSEIEYPPKEAGPYYAYSGQVEIIASSNPDVVFSGIIDSGGILSYSNSVDGYDLSDRKFYLDMKNDPGRKYIVSNTFKSPEGRLLILQGEQYYSDSDRFEAMAVIATNFDSFSKWITKLDYNGEGVISIIDSNRVIISQNGNALSRIGTTLQTITPSQLPLYNFEYLEFSENLFLGLEHEFKSIRRISDFPLFIVIEEDPHFFDEIWYVLVIIITVILITHILAIIVFRAQLVQLYSNRELRKALNELNIYFSNSLVGIAILRGGRIIFRVNRRLATLFGYDDPDEVKGRSVDEFHISRESAENFGRQYYGALINRDVMKIEYPMRHRDGSTLWFSISGSLIDENEPPDINKGVVWIFEDITERRRTEQKLKELASTDSLTGLHNRRRFLELAEREFAIFDRHERPLCILMIDIDHFKKINDTRGHATGDRTLMRFASICRDNLRIEDLAGRIGGEEFACILPETGIEEAARVAERIRARTEEQSASEAEGLPQITVSIGIAEVSNHTSLDELMANADRALYRAKHSGRNRIEIDDDKQL